LTVTPNQSYDEKKERMFLFIAACLVLTIYVQKVNC
jgi:hypothetical protein